MGIKKGPAELPPARDGKVITGERDSERIMREVAAEQHIGTKEIDEFYRAITKRAPISDLFTQYKDKLVRVTYVSGEGISQGIGYLRRETGGFWDLVCDPDVSGAVLDSTAIRCDLICQVEGLNKAAIVQAQLDAQNAQLRGMKGMALVDEPRTGGEA